MMKLLPVVLDRLTFRSFGIAIFLSCIRVPTEDTLTLQLQCKEYLFWLSQSNKNISKI